ncbi:MAG: hypothetical protein LCH26_03920 [Proteobacteria bacterium]|nr:hypothetical protein [Pseudomonadota bacterium]
MTSFYKSGALVLAFLSVISAQEAGASAARSEAERASRVTFFKNLESYCALYQEKHLLMKYTLNACNRLKTDGIDGLVERMDIPDMLGLLLIDLKSLEPGPERDEFLKLYLIMAEPNEFEGRRDFKESALKLQKAQ